MAFDGEAFVRQFGRVWNEHDLDGILAMFTDDVVFEARSRSGSGATAARRCSRTSCSTAASPG